MCGGGRVIGGERTPVGPCDRGGRLLFGPNGIYLFGLEAQPGGPLGRSDKEAGLEPIAIVDRPRVGTAPEGRSSYSSHARRGTENTIRATSATVRGMPITACLTCSYPLKKAMPASLTGSAEGVVG